MPSDATEVAQLDRAQRGPDARSADAWKEYLLGVADKGGVSAVLIKGGEIIGFATTPAVPGLPDYNNLTGGLLKRYRGKNFGSFLMQETLKLLSQKAGVKRRVVCRVEMKDTRLAAFYEKNGFKLQHRDLHMQLDNLLELPPVELPHGLRRRPFRQNSDEAVFIQYHTLAFSDQPRFQPYSLEDVQAAQEENFRDDDIFLLETEQGESVGFVWSISHGDTMQIEPLGVSPRWRNQGLGRLLLYTGLHHGKQRGATQAELWTGEDNVISIKLYEHAGFKITGGFAIYYVDIG
jgi:ribosomal protein S18 acetylase RimI-like enzyme